MMLAAGFSLLKLMHNFLGEHNLDIEGASQLLSRTVWALRSMSVSENDLAERLAEVLAQVWKTGKTSVNGNGNGDGVVDDSLQLKVKCRMSVSLVFDSVWRWRQSAQFAGGKPSEGMLITETRRAKLILNSPTEEHYTRRIEQPSSYAYSGGGECQYRPNDLDTSHGSWHGWNGYRHGGRFQHGLWSSKL
jgi:hypothetical protein